MIVNYYFDFALFRRHTLRSRYRHVRRYNTLYTGLFTLGVTYNPKKIKIECTAVLAHEYAHVWLNERFVEASPPVVEGFCNLVAEAALAKERSKLASIILENMKKSDNPIYGRGFRQMKQKLDQVGWSALLKELISKARLPTF